MTTPYAAPAATKTNVLSIITLVTGILGMAIIPVILGHISLSQIKKTGEQGRVMAIIGLVLGYIGLVTWIIVIIASIAVAGIAVSNGDIQVNQ